MLKEKSEKCKGKRVLENPENQVNDPQENDDGSWGNGIPELSNAPKSNAVSFNPKNRIISNRKTREAKKHWETRNIEANAVWMGLKSKKRVKQGSKASWRIAWKGWRGQPERFCLQNTIESSSPHELEKPELRRDFFRRALGQNQNDCCCSAIQEDYSIEKRSFTCKEIGRSSLWRSCSADRGWVGRNQRRSRTKRKGLRLSQGTCAFRRFWPFLKLKALKWV